MYVTYQATLEADGARIVPVPTRPEDGFRVDPQDIAARVGPRTRAIVLATPANPSGAVLSAADMAAIASIARDRDLWLVVDEVYESLKRFGPLEVLKGISLTAKSEDVISIIGASGSGKSTFLRCINFLETPDGGRIVVGGEEIRIKQNRRASR
jgi:aspartate/methionine/tyrosine aminotransferase